MLEQYNGMIIKENKLKIMAVFDNDTPMQIGEMSEKGEFHIILKDLSKNIIFEKDGKTFKIYIEKPCN